MSLISTLTDCIDSNNGISSPLCSKNGLICSINGFTVNLTISSIFSNLFCELLKKIIPGYITRNFFKNREPIISLINVNILNCFIKYFVSASHKIYTFYKKTQKIQKYIGNISLYLIL